MLSRSISIHKVQYSFLSGSPVWRKVCVVVNQQREDMNMWKIEVQIFAYSVLSNQKESMPCTLIIRIQLVIKICFEISFVKES